MAKLRLPWSFRGHVSHEYGEHQLLLVAVLPALLLLQAPAFAGSFTLIEGKQYELCREYAENLAAFPQLSDKTYEWPLGPKRRSFSKLRWKAVDVQEHMDIVKTLYTWNYRGYGGQFDPEQIWQSRSSEVRADIAQHGVRLDMAKADFNHTGSTDTVYRYFHELPARDQANSGGTQKEGYWYIYKSSLNARISDKFRTYEFYGRFFDSFLFKGRFYLTTLERYGRDMATTLTIFAPMADVKRLEAFLNPVCRYRYRG
jgi:hypothetical protein